MTKNIDNKYFITYSNYFELEGKTSAFRKKCLFDISNVPKFLEIKDNNNCKDYWINCKWFTLLKIESKTIDVSELQWYDQIKLDHIFNL